MKKLILCALGAAAMAPCASAAGVGESNDATEKVAPATFEDLGLAPDSYWRGDVDDEDYDYGSFRSGDFEFPNFYMSDYDTWAWYAYSSVTANNGTSFLDQFQSAPGGGHNSATFGLAYVDAYMGPSQVWVYGPEEGTTLEGMWVTNGAWTRYCVLNGDGYSGPFEKGDYLKVIVTGYDFDDNVTGTAEYYLADYRSEDPDDHYALDTWEWMDLSAAGKLQYFEISMETTKVNEWGATTPMYVCIDDLNTPKDVSSGVSETLVTAPAFRVVPGIGELTIVNAGENGVRVFNMNGMAVAELSGKSGSVKVPQGMYIVSDGVKSHKVVVR